MENDKPGMEWLKFEQETIKAGDPREIMTLEQIQEVLLRGHKAFTSKEGSQVKAVIITFVSDNTCSCSMEGAVTPSGAMSVMESLEAAFNRAIPEFKVIRLLEKLMGGFGKK